MDFANSIALRSLFLTAALYLISALFYSSDAAVSLLAGGLVAVVNFRLSSKVLKMIVVPHADPVFGKAVAVFSFTLRYLMLGVVIYYIISSGISAVFFIIGLSVVIASIFSSLIPIGKEAA